MKINYSDKTKFSAKFIAQSGKLKICKVTDNNDIKFLKDFCEKTDFKTLMPNLNKKECDRWHEMLEYAVDCAEFPKNTTYIELLDNKLCGIITCFQNKTTFIDCICAIPTAIGKKVKFGGKTLFYQVFKDFIEYNGSRIKLSAIVDGPYNTINKYKELGFKETSNVTNTYVEMDANQYSVKRALKMLEKFIPYKSLPEEKVKLK